MTVQLASGGEITLNASVPWFHLRREDREFVFNIIDQMREYGEAAKDRDTRASTAASPA